MSEEAFNDAPELGESYQACEAEVRQFLAPLWTATETLPAAVRPFVHAIHGWAVRTDRIADEGSPEGREERFARWRADTLAELRSGRSGHPVRRAFVDTVRRWDLDQALVEEHLDAVRADCAAVPAFETFADLRRDYLRGTSGAVAELWSPLLQPRGPEAPRRMSALGEACQMADVFQDLSADLAAGRCYLPGADLRRFGLTAGDLRRGDGGRQEALGAVVDVQLAHWRGLLDEAAPVTAAVREEYQPFLHTLLLGAELHYDEVALLGSRALADGVAPLSPDGGAPLGPDGGAGRDHRAKRPPRPAERRETTRKCGAPRVPPETSGRANALGAPFGMTNRPRRGRAYRPRPRRIACSTGQVPWSTSYGSAGSKGGWARNRGRVPWCA